MQLENILRRVRAGSGVRSSRWRQVLPGLSVALCAGQVAVAAASEPAGREVLTATATASKPEAFTIVRTKQYLKVVDAECGFGFCNAEVASLKDNKLLRVQNVSCRIDTASEAQADFVALIAEAPESAADFDIFVPQVISGFAPNETWSFNHETTFYAYPGRRVSIQAEFNNGSLDAMTCKVAGELQTVR